MNSTKNRINQIPVRPEYYVYAHTKENGTVFYIGKGKWDRAWAVRNREPMWHDITKNEKWKVILLADCLAEEKALEYEKEMIEHFSKFGELVNWHGNGKLRAQTHIATLETKSKDWLKELCKI